MKFSTVYDSEDTNAATMLKAEKTEILIFQGRLCIEQRSTQYNKKLLDLEPQIDPNTGILGTFQYPTSIIRQIIRKNTKKGVK